MSGWITKKLGEVCEILDSRRIPITRKDRKPGHVPYYGATGQVDSVADYIFNERLLLLGEDGADWSAGANSAFIIEGKSWVNNHAHVLRPLDFVSDCWLMYYLNATDLNEWVSGTTVPKLNQRNMCDIPIPIPPLAEQKRIVAKIDAAFEKIDKLKANAEKNLANAKELFQSALDEAMRPKKGWVEKRLGEVGSCKNGLNFKRAAEGEKIDIVGVSDFKKGLVVDDATELERLTLQELPEQEWYLHPNDIVFVRSNGSKALVGRAVIIKSKRPLTFSGFCIRYRIEDKRIDPDYLARIVSVESFRKAMLSGRNATTINNVTQPILLSQVISIPSLGEQKQIIKHLDFLSEKIKMLEQNYARQVADCAEMRQAILREAFEGRL